MQGKSEGGRKIHAANILSSLMSYMTRHQMPYDLNAQVWQSDLYSLTGSQCPSNCLRQYNYQVIILADDKLAGRRQGAHY